MHHTHTYTNVSAYVLHEPITAINARYASDEDWLAALEAAAEATFNALMLPLEAAVKIKTVDVQQIKSN